MKIEEILTHKFYYKDKDGILKHETLHDIANNIVSELFLLLPQRWIGKRENVKARVVAEIESGEIFYGIRIFWWEDWSYEKE